MAFGAFLVVVINVFVFLFFVNLAVRLVKAAERIANALEGKSSGPTTNVRDAQWR